jgi:hypothetical protein
MEDPVKFHSVYTGTNYVPPAEEGFAESAPKHAAQSPLRIRPFTAARIAEAERGPERVGVEQ